MRVGGPLSLLAGCIVVACGEGRAPVEEPVETRREAPLPQPLDVRALELDTAPAPGAEPGRWVRCQGGALNDGARRFELCREQSQTWLDPAQDRTAIIATAVHAVWLEVAGVRARFIDGRARVEIDLAKLMGESETEGVERLLRVPVAIEHAFGTARGEVQLVTPRRLE